MSAKKIYPTAVLKTLSLEKQAAIIVYLDGDGEDKGHTIAATVAWLADDGVATSSRAVSDFRSWYLLRQAMEANQTTASEMVSEAKDQGWLKTAEDEQLAGQAFFTRLAMQERDPRQWFFAQSLNLKQLAIELEREKLKQKQEALELLRFRLAEASCKNFLKWYADKKARDIADSNLSNADKIERLRQTYFADIEELEKSGEVKLPE